MKKMSIFIAGLCFLCAGKAVALPTCLPQQGESKFISRWQKENILWDVWRVSFTCDDGRQAKIYAGDVDDPAQDDASFVIVDEKGLPESKEIFDSPCEAIKAYCTKSVRLFSPEEKAMIAALNENPDMYKESESNKVRE